MIDASGAAPGVPASLPPDPRSYKGPVRNHLLIAGTGRSGTSFLVRYLAELGLDTHLSKHGAQSYWDEQAHAGLEDMPLVGDAATLPYVVKSPYAYQFIDALLARKDIQLDGVIIPIRDLIEAASSRCLVEMQHLHQVVPWLPDLDETWEQWALTPGGVVYSLNVMDQARLLATGLQQLVERLVRAGIRIGFVHFPTMITDADYLFQQLEGFLPATISITAAREAHARIAKLDHVHVGDELNTATNAVGSSAPATADTASPDAMTPRSDNRRRRADIDRLKAEVARLHLHLDGQKSEHVFKLGQLSEELSQCAAQIRSVETAIADVCAQIDATRCHADASRGSLAEVDEEIAAIRGSASWRLTLPFRAFRSVVAGLPK